MKTPILADSDFFLRITIQEERRASFSCPEWSVIISSSRYFVKRNNHKCFSNILKIK